MEILETTGQEIIDCGLKYVHNDTCYPALLVIGQFITALQSGKYDPHKTALIFMQTGGGCRASNYISLLRKALQKAGLGYVPVISFSFAGLEKHSGFQLSLSMVQRMLYAVLYGDLLMSLLNQTKPYERNQGESDELAVQWTQKLTADMDSVRAFSYKQVKQNYREILRSFAAVEKIGEKKIRVGVVGEIYIKYSPLGNNGLEDFLRSEGAETVVPGLLDFCLYSIYDATSGHKTYGIKKLTAPLRNFTFNFLAKKQRDLIKIMKENGSFTVPTPISHTMSLANGYIGLGTKMGEGWLLPAEILELIDSGVTNIVCAQPFGCLPNHICGKGMIKPIRERNPHVNIVAVDYDPGATRVNQENRIKLMLANAAEAREHLDHRQEITV